jgi:DegV family protein with EDD domain
MSKVAIVTDSTAYIPDEMLKQYNITVVPLILIWGEETYRDGVDMMPGEFYKRLASSKVMPTTSQATIPSMQDAFEGLLEQGYDVLGIFISSKLSGTVQSAIQACEMIKKGKDKIAILDSLATIMAMGWPVLDRRTRRPGRREPGGMPKTGRESP